MSVSPAAALRFPELAASLGERYTESSYERAFYRRDLASVPRFLETLFARTLPHAVARPQSVDEVTTLVRYANAHRVPITPRAAGTTAYWNSVPVREGLVVDLNGMRGLVGVDEERMTATVLAATRWGELEAELQRRGYATLSYPTSAPSATVGGWVNMEGYGIGSLKYGGLANQLKQIQVVLPNGEVFQATQDSIPSLKCFLQSEGTLGIITSVELAIRRKPEATSHHLIAFADIAALERAAIALASSTPTPYHIHFSDAVHSRLLRQAGFPPPTDKSFLTMTYDGSAQEIASSRQMLERLTAECDGEELDNGLAGIEWLERFTALRVKRAGPTLLGAEVWLPLDKLADYIADAARLSKQQRLPIATYGTVATSAMATVMSVFPSDESQVLNYVLDLSVTKKLYDVAFHYGGKPYGIGFWNAPYLSHALSSQERAERSGRKHRLDPLNIMNPNKVYATAPLLSLRLFGLGMQTLSWVRRWARKSG